MDSDGVLSESDIRLFRQAIENESARPGQDLDQDGRVDLADLELLEILISGIPEEGIVGLLDFNADSLVDRDDYSIPVSVDDLLRQYLPAAATQKSDARLRSDPESNLFFTIGTNQPQVIEVSLHDYHLIRMADGTATAIAEQNSLPAVQGSSQRAAFYRIGNQPGDDELPVRSLVFAQNEERSMRFLVNGALSEADWIVLPGHIVAASGGVALIRTDDQRQVEPAAAVGVPKTIGRLPGNMLRSLLVALVNDAVAAETDSRSLVNTFQMSRFLQTRKELAVQRSAIEAILRGKPNCQKKADCEALRKIDAVLASLDAAVAGTIECLEWTNRRVRKISGDLGGSKADLATRAKEMEGWLKFQANMLDIAKTAFGLADVIDLVGKASTIYDKALELDWAKSLQGLDKIAPGTGADWIAGRIAAGRVMNSQMHLNKAVNAALSKVINKLVKGGMREKIAAEKAGLFDLLQDAPGIRASGEDELAEMTSTGIGLMRLDAEALRAGNVRKSVRISKPTGFYKALYKAARVFAKRDMAARRQRMESFLQQTSSLASQEATWRNHGTVINGMILSYRNELQQLSDLRLKIELECRDQAVRACDEQYKMTKDSLSAKLKARLGTAWNAYKKSGRELHRAEERLGSVLQDMSELSRTILAARQEQSALRDTVKKQEFWQKQYDRQAIELRSIRASQPVDQSSESAAEAALSAYQAKLSGLQQDYAKAAPRLRRVQVTIREAVSQRAELMANADGSVKTNRELREARRQQQEKAWKDEKAANDRHWNALTEANDQYNRCVGKAVGTFSSLPTAQTVESEASDLDLMPCVEFLEQRIMSASKQIRALRDFYATDEPCEPRKELARAAGPLTGCWISDTGIRMRVDPAFSEDEIPASLLINPEQGWLSFSLFTEVAGRQYSGESGQGRFRLSMEKSRQPYQIVKRSLDALKLTVDERIEESGGSFPSGWMPIVPAAMLFRDIPVPVSIDINGDHIRYGEPFRIEAKTDTSCPTVKDELYLTINSHGPGFLEPMEVKLVETELDSRLFRLAGDPVVVNPAVSTSSVFQEIEIAMNPVDEMHSSDNKASSRKVFSVMLSAEERDRKAQQREYLRKTNPELYEQMRLLEKNQADTAAEQAAYPGASNSPEGAQGTVKYTMPALGEEYDVEEPPPMELILEEPEAMPEIEIPEIVE